MAQSGKIRGFLRPDGQSEQKLTIWANACCNPNILGEIFEFLSVHISQIFRNFHLALPPIFRGPGCSWLRKAKLPGVTLFRPKFRPLARFRVHHDGLELVQASCSDNRNLRSTTMQVASNSQSYRGIQRSPRPGTAIYMQGKKQPH